MRTKTEAQASRVMLTSERASADYAVWLQRQREAEVAGKLSDERIPYSVRLAARLGWRAG